MPSRPRPSDPRNPKRGRRAITTQRRHRATVRGHEIRSTCIFRGPLNQKPIRALWVVKLWGQGGFYALDLHRMSHGAADPSALLIR